MEVKGYRGDPSISVRVRPHHAEFSTPENILGQKGSQSNALINTNIRALAEIKDQKWFHGFLTSEEAQALLLNRAPGIIFLFVLFVFLWEGGCRGVEL